MWYLNNRLDGLGSRQYTNETVTKEQDLIPADVLKTLTNFTAPALTRAIRDAGYKGDTFTSAKFVGLTEGNQFCYHCTFPADGGTDSTKVFLTYREGTVTVDY